MAENFNAMIEKRKDLQEYLFVRGFLLSDSKNIDLAVFPFYGNWNKTELSDGYSAYTHPKQNCFSYKDGGKCFFLFGHAYNPFTMEYDEIKVLERIASAYGTENYLDYIDEMTGVCLADNHASVKVMERSGFVKTFEGTGNYQGEQRRICKFIYEK